MGVFVPIWLVLRRCEDTNLGVFDLCHFALISPYSNGAVQIRVGLELAESSREKILNPGILIFSLAVLMHGRMRWRNRHLRPRNRHISPRTGTRTNQKSKPDLKRPNRHLTEGLSELIGSGPIRFSKFPGSRLKKM